MLNSGLFILPLIAGFLIVFSVPSLRYMALHQNGYVFLLNVTAVAVLTHLGVNLFVFVLCTILVFFHVWDFLQIYYICVWTIFAGIEGLLNALSDLATLKEMLSDISAGLAKFGKTLYILPSRSSDGQAGQISASVLSLFVGLAVFVYFFIFKRRRPKEYQAMRARVMQRHGSQLEKLLARAVLNLPLKGNAFLISLTLANNKVYVGLVQKLPEWGPHTGNSFKLWPMLSGYRDKDTRSFVIVNRYSFYFLFCNLWMHDKQAVQTLLENKALMDHLGYKHADGAHIKGEFVAELVDKYGVYINMDDVETASIWFSALSDHFEKERAEKQEKVNERDRFVRLREKFSWRRGV